VWGKEKVPDSNKKNGSKPCQQQRKTKKGAIFGIARGKKKSREEKKRSSSHLVCGKKNPSLVGKGGGEALSSHRQRQAEKRHGSIT